MTYWEKGEKEPNADAYEKMARLSPTSELAEFFCEMAGIPILDWKFYLPGEAWGLQPPPYTIIEIPKPKREVTRQLSSEGERRAETFAWLNDIFNDASVPQTKIDALRGAIRDTYVAYVEMRHGKLDHIEIPDEPQGKSPKERAGKTPITPVENPDIRFIGMDEWRKGTEDRLRDQVQLPVLEDRIAAGLGREINYQDVESYVAIPVRFAPKGPGSYIGVRVRGDSMEPIIKDGFIVVVDIKNDDPARLHGQIVAARHEEGSTIKRLARESKADKLILHSENPAYNDIILTKWKRNPIIGEVVFWWGFPG